MLIQLFDRGRGSGAGPVEYTTRQVVPAFDKDGRRIPGQMKTRIPPPVVLRGDPDRTEMLIDSSANRWKYTGGVVAFGDSDKPSDDELQMVIDDFERTFFAGLEPDQYDILWVLQTHEGNVELHFTIPRLELTSGKALNAFPPGHEKMTDAWRDKWNYAKGWERPDDPARMRLVKLPNHEEKISAAQLGQAEDPRADITGWLVSRIEAGMIENRADLAASLAEIGEITRQGKDYVSVKPEGFTKAIRLKGAIYGEDFNRERFIREAQTETGTGLRFEQEPSSERAREAAERLARHAQARARYNDERYPRHPPIEAGGHGDVDGPGSPDRPENGGRAPAEAEQSDDQSLLEGDQGDQVSDRPSSTEPGAANGQHEQGHGSGRAVSEGQPASVDLRRGFGSDSLADHLRRELGPGAIPGWSSAAEPDHDRRLKRDDPAAAKPDPRTTDLQSPERDIPDSARTGRTWLHRWRQIGSQIAEKLRGDYERVRAAIGASLDRVGRAVQEGYAAARRAEQIPAQAGQQLVAAGGDLEQSAEGLNAFLAKIGRGHGGVGIDEITQALKRRLSTDSDRSGVTDRPAPLAAPVRPWTRPGVATRRPKG